MQKPNSTNDYGHQDQQPWYKNYMVIIFVIGLPLFVVVTCIWFVFYSIQVKDTVVRDDWYMDGKTLYQDVSRDKLAHDLNLSGEMTFNKINDKSAAGNTDYKVSFYLNYPDNNTVASNKAENIYPDQLTLSISHATDIDKDRDTILTHVKKNQYSAVIKDFHPLLSKYYVQVSHENKPNWRLRQVGQLPKEHIEFKPLSSFD